MQVKDFGIRGFDLAYALLDPWDTVIIVDALPRGEAAGTLYVMEPDLSGSAEPAINPHGMDPVRVLNLAASLGTISAQVLVVGCEPQDFGDELEGRMGLSSPVQAAVEDASNMVMGWWKPGKRIRCSYRQWRGDMMNAKLVLGALGLVLIGLAVTVAPDLRRYLRIRSM